MLRPRRYKALLIFAVVFLVVFVHFARSRDRENFLPSWDYHHHHHHSHHPDHSLPPVDYFAQRPVDFVPQSPPLPPQSGKGHSVDGPIDGNKNAGPYDGYEWQRQRKLGLNMFPHASKQQLPHWRKLSEQFPVAPEELIRLPTGKPKSFPKLQAKFQAETAADKPKRLKRLDAIRASFEHAWAAYKASAMGHDELMPLRGGFRDSFNGWGATLVDTLDTLWIMDLKEEFAIAVDLIRKIDFTTSARVDIPIFETTIRYLGGLLSAYDISGHKYPVLLEKAVELGEVLISAFDTPNRMPALFYRWAPKYASQPQHAGHQAVLAEIGSLSMEFTRLAQLTKDDRYYDAIARITTELEKIQMFTRLPGMWPNKLDATACEKPIPLHVGHPVRDSPSANHSSPVIESSPSLTPSSIQHSEKPVPTDIESYTHFLDRRDGAGVTQDAQPANYRQIAKEKLESQNLQDLPVQDLPKENDCRGTLKSHGTQQDTFGMGGQGDSTYEYLPKEYLLLGGQNEQYRTMYEKAMMAAREHLLFRPMVKHGRDLRFVATADLGKSIAEISPEKVRKKYEGTHLTCFAGGMFAIGAKLFDIKGDMEIAAKLTDGCVWAYESTYTGIMPESFQLVPCKKDEPCTWDETRYKNALDPWREERIVAEKALNQEFFQAKDVHPSAPATANGIAYRRSGHVTQIPRTPTGLAERGLIAPSPGEEFSHSDDYVKMRIQSERLPPGFTRINAREYLLRPEAVESIFYMYRLTGDKYWQEKGWQMFENVFKHTRTEMAHSSIADVTSMEPQFLDRMESFWLAETLKYFYLLFSDPSVVDLDEYVLNTEAHPLKRPS